MKCVGKILPVNLLLKKWNIIDEDKCSFCGMPESMEHVLGAQCQEGYLLLCVKNVIGNCSVLKKNTNISISWLKDCLFKHWTFRNAMGILNNEIAQELTLMKCKQGHFTELTKASIQIGYRLWENRCRKIYEKLCHDDQDLPT